MSNSTQIRCQGCSFKGILLHRPIVLVYALPDGGGVTTYREHSWCSYCNTVVDSEPLLDDSKIRKKIEKLRPTSALNRLMMWFLPNRRRHVAKEINLLHSLLQIAVLRKSVQRCLKCGNDTATTLEFNASGVSVSHTHMCGGRLFALVQEDFGVRVSYRVETISLDADGRRTGSSLD